MKALVTNADGYFAQALLPALCAHPAIEGVTGLGARAPRFTHPAFRAAGFDFRDAAALHLLPGHDALIHLAQNASRDASASETVDAAVRPAHRFFHAAHDAGVRRLVHVSSAAVYGPAVHASEQAPLKPLPGFRYAEEQAHLEQLLAIDFPRSVRLRAHLIMGPHAHPALKRFLRQPFYPRRAETAPRFQCVHEDDLVSALFLCLDAEARGVYNLATEDSFSLRDAIRGRHWVSMGLTPSAAQRTLGLANRFLDWDLDPAWLTYSSHTVLVNCRRAIIELGWRRRYDAKAALAAT